MKPGMIRFRGYAIEDLIGRVGFADMVYLLTRGELPHPEAARLLEAALVAAVDHGPQAPSIAAARMAVTCGVGINNAMASAINMLGDVHGGAGEQCVALYNAIAERLGEAAATRSAWRKRSRSKSTRWRSRASATCRASATASIRAIRARRGCWSWWTRAAKAGVVSGRYAAIGRAIEAQLAERAGAADPDEHRRRHRRGLRRARICRRRSAAACSCCRARSARWRTPYEEMQSGERNKGPIPRHLTWSYTGPPPRRCVPR